MSELKEKILFSLLAGIAYGFSVTPRQKRGVIKDFAKIWKCSDKKASDEVRNLAKAGLIKKIIQTGDGSYRIELTEKGKFRATEYQLIRKLRIKDEVWDGKWRVIFFDVPEQFRRGRNALRWKIKKLGFYELQKSVFVIPYECKKEIDIIVNYFVLSKYVYYGSMEIAGKDINEKLIKEFKL